MRARIKSAATADSPQAEALTHDNALLTHHAALTVRRRMSSSVRAALSVLVALGIAACAGDGPPPGATTTSTSTPGSGLLTAIQTSIFTSTCALSGCHNPLTRAGELDLSDAAVSYDELVNVESTCAGRIRVVPSDSVASYLLDKLGDGGTFCGTAMPLVLPPLDETELQLIRDWIDQGAPPAGGGG